MTDVPIEARIWNSDECAEYMHQCRDTFMRTTRYAKGFPSVLKFSEGGQPRWSAKAVVDWALQ